jgi:hypothetical protein
LKRVKPPFLVIRVVTVEAVNSAVGRLAAPQI